MKNNWRTIVFILSFIILPTLIFIGCSEKEEKEFYLKDDLLYEVGSGKLFTGTIKDTVNGKTVIYEVVDGYKNGKFEILNEKGKREMFGLVVKNKNEGNWRYFYPDGTLESEGNFVNDIPQGKWNFYYQNGKLKESGSFVNGKRLGLWQQYDEKGNLTAEITFKEEEGK
jgi:antitoxin component YwqK of YwqJK toxin-antitoxin module